MLLLSTNTGDTDVENRELQCQHEGGTCEFFLICWMSRGLLQGSCGGLLRGCCHRTAKSANLGTGDVSNTIDLTDLPNKDYGPIQNDASECATTKIHHIFEKLYKYKLNPSSKF